MNSQTSLHPKCIIFFTPTPLKSKPVKTERAVKFQCKQQTSKQASYRTVLRCAKRLRTHSTIVCIQPGRTAPIIITSLKLVEKGFKNFGGLVFILQLILCELSVACMLG
jgi:hypothetical protein